MKVLFCVGKAYYAIRESFTQRIKEFGLDVTCLLHDKAKHKENIIKNIRDVTIYITAVALADRDVIDAAPNLKYIIKTGTGVDNIDIPYAKEKGIIVSNAPGQNANAVAELVIGLMISLSRNIPQLDRKTKEGYWVNKTGFECRDKTLGIIGFGAIGKNVAVYAKGFNMNILAFSHYKDDETARELGVKYVELKKLLKDSDYIVVSTSLKKSNYHLIDEQVIHEMKNSAYLINISRGAILDEKAVLSALRKREIRGAALDVFEIEPPIEKLNEFDNLIATPHIGGESLESAERIADVTIDNIRRFLENEPIQYIIHD
ncbi:phosphoglycerate dehydrogenase [Terrilactibacillus laevilacticus]|uniref:phosphoglycerate dehydrogenase n=1 Tax=Terrilactibacillus laevilacticus TaxID=1380157 RepID=UPI001146D0A5|nr:phosphoglycerate dehydrogenase [Terrilactibacillus laevilacticus]